MYLIYADGMANSVDPDQTAPKSNLIWVYTVCADLSVRKLKIRHAIDCFGLFLEFT